MYYHTCPYCGANLDPDERCDCLSRIWGKAPKWSGMDGVRTRSPQEVCPCPLKLGSLFDGIGVFPLAASRCGIVLVWASEIARAPLSITR